MIVHSFESLAAVDGEGLRCMVFLIGCPLRCVYCHNPDTWNAVGTEYTPNQLVKKIARYKPYFGTRGGVTFSGGEPLLHAKEIKETAQLLKKENINYAIDTSGSIFLSNDVKEVVKNSSMVICDLKMWDEASYVRYTGAGIKKTMEFLNFCLENDVRLWVRTVIIPGINDKEEVLDKYIDILRQMPGVEKYQLLGFHTMGFYKYENLGIKNPLKETEDLLEERLNELQEYVNKKMNHSEI